jgi:serine/threonine-protein kinase
LADFKVGDVIGDKYEVTGVLGQGGMGVVLAARHRVLDRSVALKFLHPSLQGSAESCARFIQEARAGSRITNEHVAHVYDVETVDGVPFMVMEHLTGKDLGAILQERGKLDFVESAHLLLQACEGITEAHAMGIVHRDLKPGNLFITTKRDGTPLVKVLDFGISKSTAPSDMSVTAGAAVFGSPHYMSPEQFASTRNVDARTDVWSLGVILYELLTGRRPFPGDTLPEVYAAVHACTYTRPSRYRPNIPPALEQLISAALVQDPDKRLPSVEAFASPLAPFATAVGRASYDRIQPLDSTPSAPSERTGSRDGVQDPPESVRSAAASEETSPGRVIATSNAVVVPPPSKTEPASRRWLRYAVPAVLAAAAIVVPRFRPTRATAGDPRITPSVDPTPTSSGSVASDRAAVDDTKPTGSATTDPTPSAATRAEETAPSTSSIHVENVTAQTAGTLPAQAPASAAACASGATAACEAACAANRPGSCLKLAAALDQGVGAPKDVVRAATLYQTACDSGSGVACNDLGVHYASGDGVTRDALKAFGFYRRGCDHGSPTACVNLGAMEFEGNGVPKNEQLGTAFFLRGCEAGDALGCLNLSVAYGSGRGVPKDPAQAFAFADRACTAGNRSGCVRTALAKVSGSGVTKDVQGGIAQLDGMCIRREVTACESLAKIYTTGMGADVPADPLRFREYSKRACDLGSKASCGADRLLGKIDSVETTALQTNGLYQTKCDGGNLLACSLLGENLVAGTGTSVDRDRGLALLKKACAGGVERACRKLGETGGQ